MLNKLLPIALLIIAGVAGFFLFASDGIPTPTSTASNSNEGLAANIPAKVDEYLNAYVEQDRFSGSVLIAQGDDLIVRKGFSQADREHDVPNTPATKFRLGSVTKQFTAMAVLQLQQQGKLNVQDPISTYRPDYPNGDRITVENLLNHTSGIPNFTSFDDYQQVMRRDLSPSEIIDRFKDRDLEFEPGSQYRYSNSNYLLLGHLIEQISGQSYASFVQDHIFDPLGMNDSGYDRHAAILENRAEGYNMNAQGELVNAAFIDMSIPHAAGALYSTVDDLRKWDRALSTDRLLNDSVRQQMFTPGKGNYGYGWIIDDVDGHKRISHNGGVNGFVTNISRFPDDDVVIVVLSNFMHAPLDQLNQDLPAIVFGEDYQLPSEQSQVQLDASVLERYVGTYRLNPQTTATVTREGDHLVIQLTGQPPVGLFPTSRTEFFLKQVNAEVTFTVNEAGEVTGLVIHQAGQDIPAQRISSEPNGGDSGGD